MQIRNARCVLSSPCAFTPAEVSLNLASGSPAGFPGIEEKDKAMRNRTVVWMLVFLFAVFVVVLLLFAPLRAAFLANPLFNGMIIGVLAVGIGVVFQQVLSLQHERL